MQRIQWVKQLSDFIEETLPSVLSVDEYSAYIGLSKAHMQRQFKLATGLSIGNYIRHRRLSRAALDIATTDKRIIDIAMDYDFESQEAFGRAFRKFFGVTPKNLKKHPALANNLSTIPLTLKYLTLFPKIANITPQKIMFEPLQLHGVMQHYRTYRLEEKEAFLGKLDAMWENFSRVTAHWQPQPRRYFTVECRNACSVENGDFTMMAMCTGQPEPHEELISFTLPQREMLSFTLTNNADATEFLTYLYCVYLPENKLFINRMPILWEAFEDGRLICNISVAQWASGTPNNALVSLEETSLQLPTLKGHVQYQQIPFNQQQTVDRLAFLMAHWKSQLSAIHLTEDNQGTILLIGDLLDNKFTPEFEFHSRLFTIDGDSTDLKVNSASYLRGTFSGTLNEIADAIEYVKYWALNELPVYSVHGYEILLKVAENGSSQYQIQLLFPVKKR